MTARIFPPDIAGIEIAARELREGKLVAFPTETVYGLGADANNAEAVQEIFRLKGRPATNPLIVHLFSEENIELVADVHSELLKTRLRNVSKLWPGPLSVVLPKKESLSSLVTGGGDAVAVRIPSHPVARRLLEASQCAIAAPSANTSLYVSATRAEHVKKNFEESDLLILDDGPSPIGIESTVVSFLEPQVKILRPGSISKDLLESALHEIVFEATGKAESGPLLSPGQMQKHYCPNTPLYLLSEVSQEDAIPKEAIFLSWSTKRRDFGNAKTLTLSSTGTLEEVAKNLYAKLREIDEQRCSCIVIDDSFDNSGIGRALHDRLQRARTPLPARD